MRAAPFRHNQAAAAVEMVVKESLGANGANDGPGAIAAILARPHAKRPETARIATATSTKQLNVSTIYHTMNSD